MYVKCKMWYSFHNSAGFGSASDKDAQAKTDTVFHKVYFPRGGHYKHQDTPSTGWLETVNTMLAHAAATKHLGTWEATCVPKNQKLFSRVDIGTRVGDRFGLRTPQIHKSALKSTPIELDYDETDEKTWPPLRSITTEHDLAVIREGKILEVGPNDEWILVHATKVEEMQDGGSKLMNMWTTLVNPPSARRMFPWQRVWDLVSHSALGTELRLLAVISTGLGKTDMIIRSMDNQLFDGRPTLYVTINQMEVMKMWKALALTATNMIKFFEKNNGNNMGEQQRGDNAYIETMKHFYANNSKEFGVAPVVCWDWDTFGRAAVRNGKDQGGVPGSVLRYPPDYTLPSGVTLNDWSGDGDIDETLHNCPLFSNKKINIDEVHICAEAVQLLKKQSKEELFQKINTAGETGNQIRRLWVLDKLQKRHLTVDTSVVGLTATPGEFASDLMRVFTTGEQDTWKNHIVYFDSLLSSVTPIVVSSSNPLVRVNPVNYIHVCVLPMMVGELIDNYLQAEPLGERGCTRALESHVHTHQRIINCGGGEEPSKSKLLWRCNTADIARVTPGCKLDYLVGAIKGHGDCKCAVFLEDGERAMFQDVLANKVGIAEDGEERRVALMPLDNYKDMQAEINKMAPSSGAVLILEQAKHSTGLDLVDFEHLYLVNPHPNYQQMIGRVLRACQNTKAGVKGKPPVQIHMLVARHPVYMSADEELFAFFLQKRRREQKKMQQLKNGSIGEAIIARSSEPDFRNLQKMGFASEADMHEDIVLDFDTFVYSSMGRVPKKSYFNRLANSAPAAYGLNNPFGGGGGGKKGQNTRQLPYQIGHFVKLDMTYGREKNPFVGQVLGSKIKRLSAIESERKPEFRAYAHAASEKTKEPHVYDTGKAFEAYRNLRGTEESRFTSRHKTPMHDQTRRLHLSVGGGRTEKLVREVGKYIELAKPHQHLLQAAQEEMVQEMAVPPKEPEYEIPRSRVDLPEDGPTERVDVFDYGFSTANDSPTSSQQSPSPSFTSSSTPTLPVTTPTLPVTSSGDYRESQLLAAKLSVAAKNARESEIRKTEKVAALQAELDIQRRKYEEQQMAHEKHVQKLQQIYAGGGEQPAETTATTSGETTSGETTSGETTSGETPVQTPGVIQGECDDIMFPSYQCSVELREGYDVAMFRMGLPGEGYALTISSKKLLTSDTKALNDAASRITTDVDIDASDIQTWVTEKTAYKNIIVVNFAWGGQEDGFVSIGKVAIRALRNLLPELGKDDQTEANIAFGSVFSLLRSFINVSRNFPNGADYWDAPNSVLLVDLGGLTHNRDWGEKAHSLFSGIMNTYGFERFPGSTNLFAAVVSGFLGQMETADYSPVKLIRTHMQGNQESPSDMDI